jgi:putative transcriptional regulator
VRFSTLEAMCRVLGCQPGDLLEYVEDERAAPGVEPAAAGPGVAAGDNR